MTGKEKKKGKLIFIATDRGVTTYKKSKRSWKKIDRSISEIEITCIDCYKNKVIAGSRNGLYLSEDAGESWREVEEGLTIEHIRWVKFHTDDSDIVLVGTEPAAIFISKDGGYSFWKCQEVSEMRNKYGWYLPYSSGAGCVRDFDMKDSRAYAAVEVGGALKSENYGEKWQLVEGSTGKTSTSGPPIIHHDVHSIQVHPSSSELVYAPCGGGFYRSRDGGKKWERLYECYCRAVWVDPEDSDRIVLGPADDVDINGRIEISKDGGENWKSASDNLSTPWPNHMVERFTQSGEELLAVLSSGEVIITKIGSWEWEYILPENETAHALTTNG